MKKLFLLIVFVVAFTLEAGYYGHTQIDTYDPATGLYYKAVVIQKESGGFLSSSKGSSDLISNIAIFSPAKNSHSLLFKKDIKREINLFLFETDFKEGSIYFNGEDHGYNANIKNNQSIEERKLRDKLLIGIRKEEKRLTELWTAKKDGSELQKLVEVSFDSSWHIDIKNSKLRIVTIKNGDFKIDSLDW